MKEKRQKRIAVVNDFSGFGRCSLMVSVPIISAMKIQCCALPTAVFSNHTGYDDYFFDDYTDRMRTYYEKWQKLGLEFDGIYTGFLGSVRQVAIVEEFIADFANKGKTYNGIAESQNKSVQELENQRQTVVGVSTDEELSNMIKFQQGFNAASRYFTVVSEMVEHLITRLGG